MTLVPRVMLKDGYTVPRLITGAWQLSEGHSARPRDKGVVFDAWARLVDAGFSTFDCADIYHGVEALLGEFSASRLPDRPIHIHTKFVPDLASLATITKSHVEQRIDRSLRRLRREQLDLVQFHWWDYSVPGYVETAAMLVDLVRAGKIGRIGLTNFDTRRTAEILGAGIPVASHQVQYSLLDSRPAAGMAELCRRNGVALLCYGTVAGGFLSEAWRGAPPPDSLENRSLVKYRLMIDEYGGWPAFQSLLEALHPIAVKHGVSISNVAVRAVLEHSAVAACIVGTRTAAHVESNLRLFDFELDEADRKQLAALTGPSRGPAGDVYGLERDRSGPHGSIMRYDLGAGDD